MNPCPIVCILYHCVNGLPAWLVDMVLQNVLLLVCLAIQLYIQYTLTAQKQYDTLTLYIYDRYVLMCVCVCVCVRARVCVVQDRAWRSLICQI